MTDLGDVAGGLDYSLAWGASSDGSVVVGTGNSAEGFTSFRWEDGVMIDLGDLGEDAHFSYAQATSADGNVVVGTGDSGPYEAYRWVPDDDPNDPNRTGTMKALGFLGVEGTYSHAMDVSADGSVVVGRGNSDATNLDEAFRWEDDNMVALGDLDGGVYDSEAWAISADGSVIVGLGTDASGSVAVRWEDGNIVSLGDLADGNTHANALDVSADGAIVVGWGSTASGEEAFVWDSDANQMRNLKTVLENDYNLDLDGWTLTRAEGISYDGRVIVGWGVDPNGDRQGWIATLTEDGGHVFTDNDPGDSFWRTAGNWSGNDVPDSGTEHAYIGDPLRSNKTADFNSPSTSFTCGNLRIQSGSTLAHNNSSTYALIVSQDRSVGYLSGAGTYRIQSGKLQVAGDVSVGTSSNSAGVVSLESEDVVMEIGGALALGADATFSITDANGAAITMTGADSSLELDAALDSGDANGLGRLTLVFAGEDGEGGPKAIEVAGEDKGAGLPSAAEFNAANFLIDQLTVGEDATGPVTLRLIDGHDNRAGVEALYVNTLTLDDYYGRIDLNGLNLYYKNGGDPKRLIIGDADLSYYVDDDDLSLLLANWDTETGWKKGEFDCDGVVADDDLSLLLAHWGEGGEEDGGGGGEEDGGEANDPYVTFVFQESVTIDSNSYKVWEMRVTTEAEWTNTRVDL